MANNNRTIIEKKPTEAQIRRKEFLSKIASVCTEHGGACQATKHVFVVDIRKYNVTIKDKRKKLTK